MRRALRTYAGAMEPTTQALLYLLLGIVVGVVTTLAWRVSERQLHGPAPTAPPETAVVPPGVSTVLAVLRSSATTSRWTSCGASRSECC